MTCGPWNRFTCGLARPRSNGRPGWAPDRSKPPGLVRGRFVPYTPLRPPALVGPAEGFPRGFTYAIALRSVAETRRRTDLRSPGGPVPPRRFAAATGVPHHLHPERLRAAVHRARLRPAHEGRDQGIAVWTKLVQARAVLRPGCRQLETGGTPGSGIRRA